MSQTTANHLRSLSNNEANRITRESICTALLELMKTNEFKKISVSELVRKAGVSRQSFYRNYNTKEDIVLEIERTIAAQLIEKMKDPDYINNPKKWFIDFFTTVKENTAAVALLQKADLFVTIFEKIPSYIESQLDKVTPELHYCIVGSMAAVHSIARDWFNNGMKESETEMADLCLHFAWLTQHEIKIKQKESI